MNKDKVWAHRVNNLETLSNAQTKFSGIELDIVLIEDGEHSYFDVNHPPDSSIGLHLSAYLQSIQNPGQLKYWLDFKNLTEDNKVKALNHLDSLLQAHAIAKSNVIVESRNIAHLTVFTEQGFPSAYYLPMKLHEMDPILLELRITEIKNNVNNYKPTYLSFEYKDYDILQWHFPNEQKLVWFTLYGSMNKFEARMLVFRILNDEKVKVLLIPFSV